MKRSVKTLLVILGVMCLLIGSFFIGTIYDSAQISQKSNTDLNTYLFNEFKNELESLVSIMDKEHFYEEDVAKLKSSIKSTLKAADSASYYCQSENAKTEISKFNFSLGLINSVFENGLSYNDELICYGFMHDGGIKDGELELVEEIKISLIESLNTLDTSYASLSIFSLKIITKDTFSIFNNKVLDKDEHRENLLEINKEHSNNQFNDYKANEILRLPQLEIRYFGESAIAHTGTSWWTIGNRESHGDSSSPIEILNSNDVEIFLYKDDVFKLSFNVHPESYTIYELLEDGTEVKTEYELYEYIRMPDKKSAKYVVRAKWAQGSALYTFEIGLKKPDEWTSD
jgi:hypothetical protein